MRLPSSNATTDIDTLIAPITSAATTTGTPNAPNANPTTRLSIDNTNDPTTMRSSDRLPDKKPTSPRRACTIEPIPTAISNPPASHRPVAPIVEAKRVAQRQTHQRHTRLEHHEARNDPPPGPGINTSTRHPDRRAEVRHAHRDPDKQQSHKTSVVTRHSRGRHLDHAPHSPPFPMVT